MKCQFLNIKNALLNPFTYFPIFQPSYFIRVYVEVAVSKIWQILFNY